MDNTESFNSSELNELVSKYAPFLKEIRKRIIFTVSVFVLSTIIGFIFYEDIIKLLINILSLRGINIVFTSPFQFINLAISCGIASGLIVTFPLLVYQVLSFLKPGLRKKEYKTIVRFLPFSLFLFLLGFSFGIIVMKWQIQLFLTKSVSLGIGNILDINNLMSTVLLVSVLMGIAFQSPIVILILTRIGIINHRQLKRKHLWIYLGSLMFTFFLPLDSLIADALLVLPLIILFEFTLMLSRILEKKSQS